MARAISRVRTYLSREEDDLFLPLIEEALPDCRVEADYQFFNVRVVIKGVTVETIQRVSDVLARLGLTQYIDYTRE